MAVARNFLSVVSILYSVKVVCCPTSIVVWMYISVSWLTHSHTNSLIHGVLELRHTNNRITETVHSTLSVIYTFIGNITGIIGHSVHVNFTINLVYTTLMCATKCIFYYHYVLFALVSSVHCNTNWLKQLQTHSSINWLSEACTLNHQLLDKFKLSRTVFFHSLHLRHCHSISPVRMSINLSWHITKRTNANKGPDKMEWQICQLIKSLDRFFATIVIADFLFDTQCFYYRYIAGSVSVFIFDGIETDCANLFETCFFRRKNSFFA